MHETTHPTILTTLVVFVTLLLLLAATVALAFVDLQRIVPLPGVGLLTAMCIAALKAILIALYFMHIRYGTKLQALFAAAGFAWVAVMLVLAFCDYVYRAA